MRLRRANPRILALVGACLGLALWLASPAAAATIAGVTGNRFSPTDVTMAQGERLVFQNQDPVANHNAVAVDNGPDGAPLFNTEIIPGGQERFVEGSQYLTTGNYAFYCAVHPSQMRGSLQVSGAGTPVPRPQSGPSISISIVDGRLGTVRRRRALRARATGTAGSTARLRASARIRGRTVTLGSATVAFTENGSRTVSIGLTRSARRAIRNRRTVRVTVTARTTNAAGASAEDSASKTLSP